jgi:tRNA A-37 threonylcarbamoyl transferase component Bud32
MLEIPTPKPLAYIEQRKGLLVWNSYLITPYIEGQKLDDFLQDESVHREHRVAVTRQIIQLLEKLWKYRITHGDLKHTNVLVTKTGPVLTDLDGMIVHRWRLLYRNKQAKDMERFLRVPDGSPMTGDGGQMLISGRKAFRHGLSSSFDKVRMDGWVIRIHKSLSKDNIASLLSVTASHADRPGHFARVPSSDYTRVFKCNVSANGQSPALYLKQYLYRSMLDFAKHLLRPSRAKRAYNASLVLHKNGFDAPAIMGLFERRLGPFCTGNLLLTEEVANAKSMPQLLTDMGRSSDDNARAAKRALIRAFAKTVGQMHAKGIFHGDLRLGNVLVVKEPENWRFYFIDNERTRKFHRLPARLRLGNLIQVNMIRHGISNADRLRFFKLYLSENRRIQGRSSKWAKRIIAGTNRRSRKKAWFEDQSL